MSRTIKRVTADFATMGYEGWEDGDDTEYLGVPGEEPPAGECWQVWQDVSEPTPISPVFVAKSDCTAWVARSHKCSLISAEAFVDSGWAPSFVGTQAGLYSGVQMAAGLAAHMTHLAPAGSLQPETRIRHKATGIDGIVLFRFPQPNGAYYGVRWERGLPSLLEQDPSIDPNAPMDAGCREDAFEVLP